MFNYYTCAVLNYDVVLVRNYNVFSYKEAGKIVRYLFIMCHSSSLYNLHFNLNSDCKFT